MRRRIWLTRSFRERARGPSDGAVRCRRSSSVAALLSMRRTGPTAAAIRRRTVAGSAMVSTRLEGGGVDGDGVIEVDEGLPVGDGAHGVVRRRRHAFAGRDGGAAGGQGLGQGAGGPALGVGEADVAAREREAVGLPDDGAADDLDGEAEVGRHAAHDGELLEVLEAEVGPAGAGDGEQLGDDGRHAVEVARARRALPCVADATDGDRGGGWVGPGRVHLADGGGEDDGRRRPRRTRRGRARAVRG